VDSFQKGTLLEDSYWEKMCNDFSKNKPVEKSLWKKAFKNVYQEKKEVFNLVTVLKKNGYRTGFLSNTETPTMNFFYEQKYNMFDVLVFSCKEGYKKPEKEIYEITLRRLNTKPREALFIDDRIENIHGAESIGIQTILFKDSEHLREKLESFSIKIG
jgi:epoxide hydrolase-like predicted phosphatase